MSATSLLYTLAEENANVVPSVVVVVAEANVGSLDDSMEYESPIPLTVGAGFVFPLIWLCFLSHAESRRRRGFLGAASPQAVRLRAKRDTTIHNS